MLINSAETAQKWIAIGSIEPNSSRINPQITSLGFEIESLCPLSMGFSFCVGGAYEFSNKNH